MSEKPTAFDDVSTLPLNCCMGNDPCICGHAERVLRGYIAHNPSLSPMTTVQRDWCLDEIGSVEGHERHDYVEYADDDLASATLSAWVDYCRDKGLM